jgi:type I restriction enzyme S subunit
VQFDFPNAEGKPYRASGGKMVYNEQLKRNIPKGWQVEQLKNILTIRSGYPFPSSSYSNHGKYKLITIKNVQDDGVNLETDNYINEIPSNLPDYCKIQVGDILLSLTGNVGRVGIMFGEGCLLNQRVATLDINNKQLKPFVYYLFSGGILRQTMLNMALGSSQANLSPVDTGEVFILFNNEYAKKFSTTVEHIYNQIVANHQQNKELTALRDFLLPLLMNGQVTVTAG